jgi:hypothetical protein
MKAHVGLSQKLPQKAANVANTRLHPYTLPPQSDPKAAKALAIAEAKRCVAAVRVPAGLVRQCVLADLNAYDPDK